MDSQKIIPDRRNAVRHKMRAPVFAIFDGVTSGMILDLSEQGLSMLAPVSPDANRAIPLKLNLPEPAGSVETTGYVAWADTLGRAGIRFSDLPADARLRLQEWLTLNATQPSHKVPKFTLDESLLADLEGNSPEIPTEKPRSIDFEEESSSSPQTGERPASTVQFEFNSLGPDLDAALHVIAERAQALTRATGAALAFASDGLLTCRASVGDAAPALGATVDVNIGFSGGCVRTGITVRCDDAASDPRVDTAVCQGLAIRSIVAAPIQYERQIVGLLEVFSPQPFAFDSGDVAVVERLARTALLTMSQNAALRSSPRG
ncbi:MAG: GAF domain-containing protein [Terriglobales bacterium]